MSELSTTGDGYLPPLTLILNSSVPYASDPIFVRVGISISREMIAVTYHIANTSTRHDPFQECISCLEEGDEQVLTTTKQSIENVTCRRNNVEAFDFFCESRWWVQVHTWNTSLSFLSFLFCHTS
jgi:hypothetical protein